MFRNTSASALILPIFASMLMAQTALGETAGSGEPSKIKFNPREYFAIVSDERCDNAVKAVDELAQKLVDEKAVPGLSIAIVHNDKVVMTKGYGVRDIDAATKVDENTVFQLASVSKPLAATVVAELVGEGKVSWDSRITELDPGFKMYEPWVTDQITVRDFFCHRSGWPDHALDLLEDIGYDRTEILRRAVFLKPTSSFRSAYAYTNFGLTEAAVAAAKAYNLSWEQACDEKLYQPLGMTSTTSSYEVFNQQPNRAFNHGLHEGQWFLNGSGRQPDAQSPAGGACSTAADMAKWMRLQLNDGMFEGKQVVAKKALDETHHPQINTGFNPINGLPEFYGLGFNVSYDIYGRLRLGHSGAFDMGEATVVNLVPAEKLGICVLTNGYPVGVAEGLAATFSDLALYGKTSQDWLALYKALMSNPASLGVHPTASFSNPPANPLPPLSNSAYTGKFENELYGVISVVETADKTIQLVLGPKLQYHRLKHYDRDIFTFNGVSENLEGACGVRFTVGPDGRANSLFLDNFNGNEQGCFQRIR